MTYPSIRLAPSVHQRRSARSLLPGFGFGLGAAAYGAMVGYLAIHDRRLAIVAAAIGLCIGLTAGNIARVAVIATVGVWLIERTPGNVSVTDLLIAVAGIAAALSGAAQAIHPRGRLVLRSFALYLATLVVTLTYNHSGRSDLEWVHRVALVGGAVCVGAWLFSTGLYRTALRALLFVTTFVAALALIDGLSTSFAAPAQPLGYQKNFVGSVVATVLLVLLAAHERFGLSRRLLTTCGLLLLGGLVATHSRGAMIGLGVGSLIWFLREAPGAAPRLRIAAVIAAVGIGIFAGTSVWEELHAPPGQHTSLSIRSAVEKQTRQLWIQHPWTGVGLRFFKTPRFAGYQAPNNVFDEIAAEAGVLGILGFAIFVGGSLVGLGRLRGDLAAAGLCVVAARFTHGLFDIYWTGGTTTLPWIIAGMGLASARGQPSLLPETEPSQV